MRGLILAALVGMVLGVAVLATTWHSGVSWDFAVSIHPAGKPDRGMVLVALVVAVALVWRWAGSRRDA